MIDSFQTAASGALHERASRVMPGGVSRNTTLRRPYPIYAASARGCRITDLDGVERIDFANNMASLIHGHSHPAIVAAVAEQLPRGTAHTLGTEIEVRFAEHLCARIDSVDQIRFVNSGTEAVMSAIKVARAFTGRTKIAKSEGAYHGTYDYAEVSQVSTPADWGPPEQPISVPVVHNTPTPVLEDVVVLPFNDPQTALNILDRHPGEIACVLLDVMPHRAGLFPATTGFATTLRDWASDDGALLLADEVITFRNRHGGAQKQYGLSPDLTALGKIIGGGFPVGAVAGSAEVMSVMNPYSEQYLMPHSGTFSANPITLTAGLAAMELFTADEIDRVNELGRAAREGIEAVIESRGFEASVTGDGSMFRIHMQQQAPRDYREAYPTPQAASRLTRFFDEMLAAGILLIYSGAGAVSTAMGEAEIERLIRAVDEALAASS